MAILQQSDDNFYDKLGFVDPEETRRIVAQQQAEGDKLDQLIHQTFAQNEAGAELLDRWSKTLILMPTAQAGMDSVEIGINEGIKTFIRNILLTVAKVESGDSNE